MLGQIWVPLISVEKEKEKSAGEVGRGSGHIGLEAKMWREKGVDKDKDPRDFFSGTVSPVLGSMRP